MKPPSNKKIMILVLSFFVGTSLVLSGCLDTTEHEKVSILVTIVPQENMVTSIGGEYVDVTIMVPAGESPHSFEPTPQQMTKVAQASAYFTVGSGVEFEVVHMDTIIEQNSDIQVFDCSENISVVSFDQHYGKEDHHEEEEHDHDYEDGDEHDHDHDGTDPHIWTSPVNFKKMAEVVYQGLIEIDPDHQNEYYSNYQAYILSLDNLHTNISTRLQSYEGRSFMVYHPAWGYFGDTYNLKMIAIEDEGKQPGPAGIASIIEQAKNESINVIFVSPQFDISSAETIAEEINGQVVFANPLTSEYQQTLLDLTDALAEGYSNI
jgi:zinc transport system substrate-binding protein